MKSFLKSCWSEDEGVLSFEWVLLATLLTIGIVAGLTAVRDAAIDELSDVAGAAINLDQSFDVMPSLNNEGEVLSPGFEFEDTVPLFNTCERVTTGPSQ